MLYVYFPWIDHTVLQALVWAGNIRYKITNNRDFSLLQPVVRDFMEKTAVSNVTIIVTRRPNVIDLQEIATEDVNQDGQGSPVMMVMLWHRRPRRRPLLWFTCIVKYRNYMYSILFIIESCFSYILWHFLENWRFHILILYIDAKYKLDLLFVDF